MTGLSLLAIAGILILVVVCIWAIGGLLRHNREDIMWDTQQWADAIREDGDDLRKAYAQHSRDAIEDYRKMIVEYQATIKELREQNAKLLEDRQIFADTLSARIAQQAKVRAAGQPGREALQAEVNAVRQKMQEGQERKTGPVATLHPARTVIGGRRIIGGMDSKQPDDNGEEPEKKEDRHEVAAAE